MDHMLRVPKLPDSIIRDPKLADYQHKIIMDDIAKFEENLNPDEEVALYLTSFGQNIIMNVTFIGYSNPSLIRYCGYVNGVYSELIQHISQINFLLTSTKIDDPEKPPRRIGFSTHD